MAVSLQTSADIQTDYQTLQFIVQQLLSRVATLTLVKVVACTNNGGVSPYGFVDVLPLVHQVSGDGRTIPHGTLYRLPYFRLQGGANAVIMDPQPDDIGMAAFCSRDISSVKADPTAALDGGAPPGSARQFDMADGLYLGGFLNAVPTQYVRFHAGGIVVESPTAVTVQAPSITLDGNVHATGNMTVDGSTGVTVPNGDVLAGNIGLKTHKHGGVTPGGGTSGTPVP